MVWIPRASGISGETAARMESIPLALGIQTMLLSQGPDFFSQQTFIQTVVPLSQSRERVGYLERRLREWRVSLSFSLKNIHTYIYSLGFMCRSDIVHRRRLHINPKEYIYVCIFFKEKDRLTLHSRLSFSLKNIHTYIYSLGFMCRRLRWTISDQVNTGH
jgi:hypothetical protein